MDEDTDHRLVRSRELLEAFGALSQELSLEALLDRILNAARNLLHAKYAALGVLSADGRLEHFVTAGIDDETARRIGPRPTGHGVLGLLITDPKPLRLHDLRRHPSAYGFPANHPPMRSFLGVPLRIRDTVFGHLYLTEKRGSEDFTPDDESLAVALATAAGVAIENARLYDEAQARSRWLEASLDASRELSEDLGPTAFNRAAAHARQGASATGALILLPEGGGTHHVVVGADGHPGLEGLVIQSAQIKELWSDQRDVPVVLSSEELPALPGLSGCSILAVGLAAEGHEGALVITSRASGGGFNEVDLNMSRIFAAHLASALALGTTRKMRDRLTLLAERDRIARDLHDLVIQRIFGAGLSLQGLIASSEDHAISARVQAVTRELDEAIRELRGTIYSLQPIESHEPVTARVLKVLRSTDGAGVVPQLRLMGPLDTLTGQHVEALLAVLREMLSNAVRHAHAHTISVTISAGTELVVVVEDDGRGFIGEVKRSGLENLRRRADTFDGDFEVRSRPGLGTRVRWAVPLSAD